MSGQGPDSKNPAPEAPKGDAPACAICGRPQQPAFKPFCSRRCADVDLSRWLSGAYVIAGKPEDEDGEA